ncbi:MAG: protein phosphatase 2C domain-containing protein [bacterium]
MKSDFNIKYGKVSIEGTYHKNQDYVICKRHKDLIFAVVSDGLGSKKFSHIGAKIICEVIEEKVLNTLEYKNLESFAKIINREWVHRINRAGYNVKDFYATCLFCIIKNDNVYLGQLGDGFICSVSTKSNKTKSALVLKDSNENHFINETLCLNKIFNLKEWKLKHLILNKNEDFIIVLATDGLSICNNEDEKIISFCKELKKEYCNFKNYIQNKDVQDDITRWLTNWKSDDDKTIAFIIKNKKIKNKK